jgi:Peptidase A4 family
VVRITCDLSSGTVCSDFSFHGESSRILNSRLLCGLNALAPRKTALATCLFLVVLLVFSSFLIPSTAISPNGSSVQTSIIKVKNSYTAGYGVVGPNDSVTNVNGSWIQPAVTCKSHSKIASAAGFIVQIDGFNGKDVELVGTGGGCLNGAAEYVAFYAFEPTTGPEYFNLAISPGDKLFASMSYSPSTEMFTAFLKDLTSGKSASATGSVPSAERNDVEVGVLSIVNSTGQCCLSLAKFSTASFGARYTQVSASCFATIGSESGPLGSFGEVLKLEMTNVNGNAIRAVPSGLSKNGSSFTISWKSSGT